MRATVFHLLVTTLVCISASSLPQPQQGPEIEKLVKAFSGTWSIVIKIEPNERLPKGGGGHGEETWRPGPAGLSLIEEYHSTGDEGEQFGLGVIWWDKDAQRYSITWCDNGNPAGCAVVKHGANWERNQVVVMDESENAGKKLVFKEVFSDITESSFTQTLYQGELSSDLKLLLKITATRKTTPQTEPPDVSFPKSHLARAQSLKMPGPSVQNRMLGTWSLTLKYAPSTERPNGATGRATEVWWAGPGGYSVIEELYQDDANEHVEEFSPAWWDSQAGGQRFVFCTNTVPEGCYLSRNIAKWEGDRNVYTEERDEGGKKMTVQEIFEDISSKSFTQIVKEGESGKALKPTITMRARKVARASTIDTRSVSTGLRPGQSFQDCPECPEMVVIPAGRFVMGSPASEPGRFYGEDPRRKVSIHQFAAGRFDVTRGEWAAFAKDTSRAPREGCKISALPKNQEAEASWRNLGFPQDDSHPVVCVKWSDAQDYVRWLSQRTGRRYRLLTEAEWEYAARAGTTTAFPWGPIASHEYANYGTEKCCGDGMAVGRDQWVETSPVGSFPPNGFGLYDMHGNVLQFVQDCFAPSYAGLATNGSAYEVDVELNATDQKLRDSVVSFCMEDVLDGENNTAKLQKCVAEMLSELSGTRSCSYRMVRGGDWGDPPKEIRSAFRAPWADSDPASSGLGFRVARDFN